MASISWTVLIVAYLIGGITLIPSIIIAFITYGYFTFPQRSDVWNPAQDEDGDVPVPADVSTPSGDAAAGVKMDMRTSPGQDVDVASGYFAVYREYNPVGINAKPIERPVPATSNTIATPSPSVYQTMYRSIFDRKPAMGPLDSNNKVGQRTKKAGNIFYVVLRHGHLMLFDDEEQLEVRHVISLAHHDIGIYSGEDFIPEGELFIKRNAICLSRRVDNSASHLTDGPISKPFFVFSENCSAKEDFYFALLKNQQQALGFEKLSPKPKQFELKSIISLVQKLHSSEEHVHLRWLNALIGRLFLAVYRTSDLSDLIADKITKKIARVKRPSFLTSVTIQKIDTGESAPYFSGLRLRDLNIEGECLVEADVKYNGNFRIEVAATAKIDLGTRFKSREVNMVLAVVLRRLEGHMLLKIKAPPSNRIWFSFQTMPKLEMVIEPIVSSRQITYAVITRQIENRIKEVFAETLVQPFWDDIPFFKTEHKKWRGGIFENDDAVEPSSITDDIITPLGSDDPADSSDAKHDFDDLPFLEKSRSQPVPESHQPPSPNFLRRKSSKVAAAVSASSTSVDVVPPTQGSSAPSQSPGSPALVRPSTQPIVGTETTHADIFKPSTSPSDMASDYMASLHHRNQEMPPKLPSAQSSMSRPLLFPESSSSSGYKEAVASQGVNDDSEPTLVEPTPRRNTASSVESTFNEENMPDPAISSSSSTPSVKHQPGSFSRSLFKRENSNPSAAIMLPEGESPLQKKKNTLAAVTSAAAQARQWGWNALQRQREAMRNGDKSGTYDLSQPMGRGQPLPPPGMPLPGPNNGKAKIKPISMSKQEGFGLAETQENENQVYAAVSQPLSHRRQRGDTRQPDLFDDQNILIVAAPNDSQPGTPDTEDKPEIGVLWSDQDGGTEDKLDVRSWGKAALTAPILHDDMLEQLSSNGESASVQNKSLGTMAFPSISMADDDYASWMSDRDEEPVEP